MTTAIKIKAIVLSLLIVSPALKAESTKKPWWKRTSNQSTTDKDETKLKKSVPEKSKPWWKSPYPKNPSTEIVDVPELTPSSIPDKINSKKTPLIKRFSNLEESKTTSLKTEKTPIIASQKNSELAPSKIQKNTQPLAKLPRANISSKKTREEPIAETASELKVIPQKRSFFDKLKSFFRKSDRRVSLKTTKRSRVQDESDSYKVPIISKKIRRKGVNRYQFST